MESGEKVAIKVLEKEKMSPKDMEHALNEVSTLKICKGSCHIV